MKGFDPKYSSKIGVLITNLGTPDHPNKKSLKKYLREFLSDMRVVDYNRILWYTILYGIILNIRPKKSAKLYEKIWTERGSPLMAHMTDILKKIRSRIGKDNIQVELGMRYGNPSLESALEKFKKNNVMKLLVIPLYPQAGSPTSSSTFDGIANVFSRWSWLPNIRFVNGYHDRKDYIDAITDSIRNKVPDLKNLEMLIFSFHGMPFRYLKEGDPYYCFCHKTARLITENLDIDEDKHSLAFQSRFGREEWLQPYIDEEIIKYAKSGVRTLHIVSPGFSVDCLETLEEIQIQYSNLFKENGGDKLVYIPCLNSNNDQINMLESMVTENLKGW